MRLGLVAVVVLFQLAMLGWFLEPTVAPIRGEDAVPLLASPRPSLSVIMGACSTTISNGPSGTVVLTPCAVNTSGSTASTYTVYNGVTR